jgi:glycerol-3-phosphate cytidylyltransferase
MKTVITYGTFDLFHIGHLKLLERSKDLGDKLIVAVSTDEFNKLKGKKTIIPFEHRKVIVNSIKCVDSVIAENSWEQKISDIKKYGVETFVMGDDWLGKFDHLKEYCNVVYLQRTKDVSSSYLKDLLVRFLNVDTCKIEEAITLLKDIKQTFGDIYK